MITASRHRVQKRINSFTCSQKGTMRFVVRCIYKEAVMDE